MRKLIQDIRYVIGWTLCLMAIAWARREVRRG